MHGHDIIFDRENKKIGIAEAHCHAANFEKSQENIPTDPTKKPEEKDEKPDIDEESNINYEDELDNKNLKYNNLDCYKSQGNQNANSSLIFYGLICLGLIVFIVISGIAIYKLKQGESFLCFKINPVALGYNNNVGTSENVDGVDEAHRPTTVELSTIKEVHSES